MMKLTLIVLGLSIMTNATSQDVITTKDGNEIEAIVKEVTVESVKYQKKENPDGPIYTLNKSEIFMIKYENGTKDVFTVNGPAATVANGKTATIYFYRPKKFANSATKVIVGTVEPDEVIVAVKNGSWYKTEYTHLGERKFVTGVFIINPETYEFNVDAGGTYYVKCTVLTKGLKVMAELEFVDQTVAEREMKNLKAQSKSFVD
ncbi:MAG: hypothetical protein ABJG78_04000 [Cyclobacteriaceae bacterium]